MGVRPRVRVTSKGDFKKTKSYLNSLSNLLEERKLTEYAEMGLKALREATPVRTGLTRDSWSYKINVQKDFATISWHNDNRASDGTPIVVLLVFGHGTKQGFYVQGDDFVTTAIEPVFDQISEKYSLEVIEK